MKKPEDIRSEALERAVYLAAHQQVQRYSGDTIVTIAKCFETYLKGA